MILLLNGYEMQLVSSAISQTFQINDLADVKDRQSGHSNSIKVPRTPYNEKVLELVGARSVSRLHTKKIPAKIICNGVEIVSNGYAVISGGNSDSYNVSIYDGIVNLNDRLADKTLKDLSYSDINHYVSLSAFQDSLQNTDGYINAVADFGNGLVIEYMPASVFASALWDKIFKEAGFTYSGKIFDKEIFRNLVLPIAKGYETISEETIINQIGSIHSSSTRVSVDNNSNYLRDEDDYLFPVQEIGEGIRADGDITITNEGTYVFDIEVTGMDVYEDSEYVYTGATLKINGNSQMSLDKRKSKKKAVLSLKEGDVISMQLYLFVAHQDNNNEHVVHNISTSSIANISISKQVGGLFLDYTELMPQLSQKDFVKDIMQRFGLIMRQNKFNEQHCEFILIEDLLNNRGNADDWSEKYISHSDLYEVGDYAKKNIFCYENNEDVDAGYSCGILEIENETIENRKEVVKSPYYSGNSKRQLNGIDLYNIPLWEIEGEEKKVIEASAHIFAIKRHDTNINVKQEGVDNYTNVSGAIPFLDFKPCCYQNYVNAYYLAFRNLLNKSKKIKALMRLNAIDIYDLDFFKLKYIEQLGGYFYLNKVSNFKGQSAVEVELVEVGDIVFNAPPENVGSFVLNIAQNSSHVVNWDFLTQDYYDRENDEIVSVRFTELPSEVSITLNGVDIFTSTEINKNDVIAGNLKIVASASEDDYTRQAKYVLKDSGSGNYSVASGTITINITGRINTSPVVNAGSDKNILLGSGAVELVGTASDDVSISSVLWTQIGGASMTINNSTNLNASVNITTEGIYRFRLTATDSDGVSSFDDVEIKCYNNFTTLSFEDMLDNNYRVTIEGEPNATVIFSIRTDNYVSVFKAVGLETIDKNTTKEFTKKLSESGVYFFDVFLDSGSHDGSVDIVINQVSEGMLNYRENSIRLFAKGIDAGSGVTR